MFKQFRPLIAKIYNLNPKASMGIEMVAYNYQLLIKHVLESGVSYAPNQEIVYRNLLRYTYKDLYTRVQKLANALEKLGVKRGSKVAILDWDSHRYLECYFAVPMMGAVLHTVNVRLSPQDISYTMQHAGDEVVLVNKDFLGLVESIRDELPTVKRYVVMADDDWQTPSSEIEYEEMLRKASSNYNFRDFDENTTATLFYTSGTTGKPKGVYYSHRKLVLHTLAIGLALAGYRDGISFRSDDVYMPLTPMFHVHAWGYPYLATLLGVKQVYPGKYEPRLIIELIKREGVTVSHCVPTILDMVLSELGEEKLEKWKVNVGGSRLPKSLALKAMEKGIRVMGGYGLSESCPVLTISKMKSELSDWEEKKIDYQIKAGIPIPLVYLRVIHDNWTDVRADERDMGEVVVRAPWLVEEYLKDPERSEMLWKGGWLHTGDIAVVDEHGYLTIVDRMKDVIKSGGEWISSLTLEELLSLHPKVREVAVVGVPDEKWGERPLAVVCAVAGETLAEDELRNHLMKFVEQGRIKKWMIPDKFAFVDEIPKTSVGKLNKKALKEMFGAI
jgi:fatty-acyl-CoA synthase